MMTAVLGVSLSVAFGRADVATALKWLVVAVAVGLVALSVRAAIHFRAGPAR
jgi:hypothetical protein